MRPFCLHIVGGYKIRPTTDALRPTPHPPRCGPPSPQGEGSPNPTLSVIEFTKI